MKVAIMTDTHSGIMPEEAKEKGIFLLNAPFMVDGEQYLEGINLNSETFYEKLESGADVSTSQSSPGDILNMWDEILKEYDQVVCIPLSSSLTGAYQTMSMLASEEPYEGRVFPVDNRSVSIVQRLAVEGAIGLVKKGYTGDEIKKILEYTRKDNIIYITVSTLKYLKKGGRITPAAAALGSLLKIKPVLEIDGGKLDAFSKVRTMSQAKETMLNAIQQALDNRFMDHDGSHSFIFLAHTQNEEMAKELEAMAKERWPKAVFFIEPLPLAIACHIGPGSLAIAAVRKIEKLKDSKEYNERISE